MLGVWHRYRYRPRGALVDTARWICGQLRRAPSQGRACAAGEAAYGAGACLEEDLVDSLPASFRCFSIFHHSFIPFHSGVFLPGRFSPLVRLCVSVLRGHLVLISARPGEICGQAPPGPAAPVLVRTAEETGDRHGAAFRRLGPRTPPAGALPRMAAANTGPVSLQRAAIIATARSLESAPAPGRKPRSTARYEVQWMNARYFQGRTRSPQEVARLARPQFPVTAVS